MQRHRSRSARFLLAAIVTAATLVGVIEVAPAPPAHAATAPIGARAGFAPTSWMLLWGSDADLARDLDLVARSGAKWLRFDFDWASAEPAKGKYNWSYIDRVVAGASARGLSVLGTIAYTPTWARPAGTSDKNPPTNLADYASFARAAAARYGPRGVHAYEVWNEPNIVQFWQPHPNAATYTSMLRQAYTAIKAGDPSATVISAGMAPAGDSADSKYVSPRTFISRMYSGGAKGSFDALGMHPYAYPYGINAAGDWNQWYSLDKTYQIMVSNGDGAKKIWGTEYGAPTGTASSAVSESGQAQFAVDAFNNWVHKSYAGPLFWYGLRDSGTNLSDPEQNFGVLRKDASPKRAYSAFTSQMSVADPNPAAATAPTTVAPSTTAAPAPTTVAPSTTAAPTTTTAPTTTVAPVAAPTTPSMSSSRVSATDANLSWTTAARVSNYVLQVSTDGTSFAPVATLDSTTRSVTAKGLSASRTYHFRVKATNSGGESPWCKALAVKTKRR